MIPDFKLGINATEMALLVLTQPFAPIAQGIEHRSPEAGAQVRFLLGARIKKLARHTTKLGVHVRHSLATA